jgi:hypothetical protein
MITNKTQVQKDISKIDQFADSTILAAAAFAHSLNNSYNSLWSLPDDRLLTILQAMYDEGTLMKVFSDHNYAATSVNNILKNGGYENVTAYDKAPRELVITDGVLSFKPDPIVVEEPEPIVVEESNENML